METTYYSLGSVENNRFVKILQIVFGLLCIAVAVFWIVHNFKTLGSDTRLWITISFLTLFGLFQIWSGSGNAARYILIGRDNIRLKKNAILPAVNIVSTDIQKIEFFPLSLIFHLKPAKKIILRFGTVYYETNDKIVDKLFSFAETNNIPVEVIEEEL